METGNKIKPIELFTDNSLTENESVFHHICFFIGFGRLQSIVFDKKNQKILALLDVAFSNNLPEIIESFPYLRYSYKEVEIVLQNANVSLIPSAVYSKEKDELYLKLPHFKLSNEQVYSRPLNNTDAVAVFFDDKNLFYLIQQNFYNAKISHSSVSYSDSMLLNTKNERGEYVFLNMFSSSFELLVIKGGKLLIYNVFDCNTAENFVYFLLFTIEQLKLNVDTLFLQLSGDIQKSDKYYQLISNYIKNINFLNKPSQLLLTSSLNEIKEHKYSKIYHHLICE